MALNLLRQQQQQQQYQQQQQQQNFRGKTDVLSQQHCCIHIILLSYRPLILMVCLIEV